MTSLNIFQKESDLCRKNNIKYSVFKTSLANIQFLVLKLKLNYIKSTIKNFI